jgi:glycosyltransferase involved in cell wall biosynthesis
LPLVSVLIPFKSPGDFFEDCLISVVNQSLKNFEVVLISDEADSQALSIANNFRSAFPHLIKIFSSPGKGIVEALNFGIEQCSASLIARMDADDIMLPNRLLIQSKYLNDNPEISILGTQVKHIDERGIEIVGRNSYVVGRENLRAALLNGCELAHPTVMFRKNIIQTLSGYRKQFQYAEDYDLWLRAREITQIDNLEQVLLLYRLHSNQSSNVYTSEQTIATRAAIISSKIRANEIHADSDCPEANETLSDWVSKISLKLPEYSDAYKFREIIKFNSTQKRTMHDLLWVSARSNSRLGIKKILPYIIKAFAIRPLHTIAKVFKIIARRIYFNLREKRKKDV